MEESGQLHVLAALPLGKQRGPQSGSGRGGKLAKRRNPCSCREWNPGRPACSLVIKLNITRQLRLGNGRPLSHTSVRHSGRGDGQFYSNDSTVCFNTFSSSVALHRVLLIKFFIFSLWNAILLQNITGI